MIKRLIFLIVPAVLLTVAARGQDPVTDLMRINNAYYGLRSVKMKLKYELFQNHNDTKPMQTEYGEMKRKGNFYYTMYGKMESVINRNYYVMVDHEDKEILISKIIREQQDDPLPDNLPATLKSLVKSCQKVEYSEAGAGLGSYTFSGKLANYSRVDLVFSTTTYLVQKVVFYYKEKMNLTDDPKGPKTYPRIDITYYEIESNPVISATEFTYEKFLNYANGKYSCKDSYKKYNLINLL